jgi:hypothetical protein
VSASRPSRVLLLGCVKRKRSVACPARDLYASPLWHGRRAYAEAAALPWAIISAEHGLVDPLTVVEPYDASLVHRPASERRAWGRMVADALDWRFGPLDELTFEMHAGRAYRDAIAEAAAGTGARFEAPLAGLGLGHQLAWYRRHGAGRLA